MQIPTVHLNGSGHKILSEQYEEMYRAVNLALQSLHRNVPHGRDYYVQRDNPSAYTMACAEHDARIAKLQSVADELLALHRAVDQQVSEAKRNARLADWAGL